MSLIWKKKDTARPKLSCRLFSSLFKTRRLLWRALIYICLCVMYVVRYAMMLYVMHAASFSVDGFFISEAESWLLVLIHSPSVVLLDVMRRDCWYDGSNASHHPMVCGEGELRFWCPSNKNVNGLGWRNKLASVIKALVTLSTQPHKTVWKSRVVIKPGKCICEPQIQLSWIPSS